MVEEMFDLLVALFQYFSSFEQMKAIQLDQMGHYF